MGDFSLYMTDVPKPKLRHYSAEARELAASDLSNFSDANHRYAIMIAAMAQPLESAPLKVALLGARGHGPLYVTPDVK